MVKKCVICGKEFEAHFPQHITCSEECRRERARQLKRNAPPRYKKICVICGKEFFAYSSKQQTCSRECGLVRMLEKRLENTQARPLICKHCGKEFESACANSRYCSLECRNAAQKKRNQKKRETIIETGVISYFWDGASYCAKAICPQCGKVFTFTDGWVYKNEDGIRFCSWSCLRKDEKDVQV